MIRTITRTMSVAAIAAGLMAGNQAVASAAPCPGSISQHLSDGTCPAADSHMLYVDQTGHQQDPGEWGIAGLGLIWMGIFLW